MKEIVCPMCGKTFRSGDSPMCGGRSNDGPFCNPKTLERELKERLTKTDTKE